MGARKASEWICLLTMTNAGPISEQPSDPFGIASLTQIFRLWVSTSRKPSILIQAGIMPRDWFGKDAGMMLLRVYLGDKKELLTKANILLLSQS